MFKKLHYFMLGLFLMIQSTIGNIVFAVGKENQTYERFGSEEASNRLVEQIFTLRGAKTNGYPNSGRGFRYINIIQNREPVTYRMEANNDMDYMFGFDREKAIYNKLFMHQDNGFEKHSFHASKENIKKGYFDKLQSKSIWYIEGDLNMMQYTYMNGMTSGVNFRVKQMTDKLDMSGRDTAKSDCNKWGCFSNDNTLVDDYKGCGKHETNGDYYFTIKNSPLLRKTKSCVSSHAVRAPFIKKDIKYTMNNDEGRYNFFTNRNEKLTQAMVQGEKHSVLYYSPLPQTLDIPQSLFSNFIILPGLGVSIFADKDEFQRNELLTFKIIPQSHSANQWTKFKNLHYKIELQEGVELPTDNIDELKTQYVTYESQHQTNICNANSINISKEEINGKTVLAFDFGTNEYDRKTSTSEFEPGVPVKYTTIDCVLGLKLKAKDTGNKVKLRVGYAGGKRTDYDRGELSVLYLNAETDIVDVNYNLTYTFESITPNKELPTEVTNQKPSDRQQLNNGTVIDKPTFDPVEVSDGTRTFKQWDNAPNTIDGADVAVNGKWEFTPKHNLTYEFVSITPNKELPKEVMDLKPQDRDSLKPETPIEKPIFEPVSVEDGTWNFIEWDPTSPNKIGSEDVNVPGKWSFVTDPLYNITYEFTSGTPDKELPKEVTNLLPQNENDVKTNTLVEKPTFDPIAVEDGVRTFTNWDESIPDKVTDSDIHVPGVWTFEKNPNLTYEFSSSTPNKELPKEISDMKPVNRENLTPGTTIDKPTFEPIEVEDGTWEFEGWEEGTPDEMGKTNVNIPGTWRFVPNYNLTYEFTSTTPDKELPDVVKNLKPQDKANLKPEAPIEKPAFEPIKVEDGTWNFDGWNADVPDKITDSDVNVPGTWTFTPDPLYNITYEFTSGTPDKELPQSIKDLIPTNINNVKNGIEVNKQTFEPVKVEDGMWRFQGWDENAPDAVDGADVHVPGTWVFEPHLTYNLTYEFTSSTLNKELPKEIVDLTPSNKTSLDDGTAIDKPTFEPIEVEDGTWEFEGWNQDTPSIINGVDAHVPGSWRFIPKHTITYEFTSVTPNKELPEIIVNQKPANKKNVKDGTIVEKPTFEPVKVESGVWEFIEWDKKAPNEVNGADVHVPGTWKFTLHPLYDVTYEFRSITPNKELPEAVKQKIPQNVVDVKDGTTINKPKFDSIEVKDGTWSFVEWNSDVTDTINGKDVHVPGTWKFVPHSLPSEPLYNIQYEFISSTPNKKLPENITKLTPDNKTNIKTNTSIDKPSFMSIKVNDGIWEFEQWDPQSPNTITDKDVTVKGIWKFVPQQKEKKNENEKKDDKKVTKGNESNKDEMVKKVIKNENNNSKTIKIVKPIESKKKDVVHKDESVRQSQPKPKKQITKEKSIVPQYIKPLNEAVVKQLEKKPSKKPEVVVKHADTGAKEIAFAMLVMMTILSVGGYLVVNKRK